MFCSDSDQSVVYVLRMFNATTQRNEQNMELTQPRNFYISNE